MQFGGHETFPLREGWLHKGLELVRADARAFEDEHVADRLGVGRNMAKSIRHWLHACGLTAAGVFECQLTALGKGVWANDPYFLSPTTWWMMHIELATNQESAYSWWWFFNNFHAERFEKPTCVDGLRRYLAFAKSRVPKDETLLRDVGCMLACYSRPIPGLREDPEDSKHSPMIELGLIDHHRESGQYRVHRGAKRLSHAVLAYSIARAFDRRGEPVPSSVLLHDLARLESGPARTFCLSPDTLFQTIEDASRASSQSLVEIGGMAGQRTVKLRLTASAEIAKVALAESREESHVA
jgi:Protein of unknown function (DUF4007)